MPTKPIIFISYSHKDRAWLDYVRSFFAPLAKHWTLTIWDDEKLRIGDDWRGDIYSALGTCDVFLLLVSRYALASNFIIEEEVGRILQRTKGEVQFCPLVLTPYFAKGLDWLNQPNRRPIDGKALSELQDPERDREMAVIAEQIDDILRAAAGRKGAPAIPSTAPTQPRAISFPSIVDYGRLPEAPYKVLVGRDAELKRLDDAWADSKTNIISLVARGGAGKTSLVIEWLVRLRNGGYRDANAVLCWSFYSQGTSERAASGEGFLDWALGKLKVKVDTTSASAKGERLAEAMAQRRVLLVLDGVEPLQHGPEGQEGALKDQGLRAFLRRFAAMPPGSAHGLVVLTSRLAVFDLVRWKDSTAPEIDLGSLSDAAGAALLSDGGVKGSPKALEEAAHDFAGHALALSLLSAFLRNLYGGDISQRSRVRPAIGDPNAAGHDHARRVLEAYEKEWLAQEPVLLTIMHLMGLFDRPASADCLAAHRRKPAIDGLTDAILDLDDSAWQGGIARLRDARLLDPEDPAAPDALDAHPLVREWFGERLRQTNEAAWKAAHGRLYDHLRDTTKEGDEPKLEDLAPLYQAIAHGCRAGRHQEALKIYRDRICRWQPDGKLAFYAVNMLGGHGSALAALSWFFEKPYELLLATLTPSDRAWVLSEAAYSLRAQGRFAEALPADRAGLRMHEDAKHWLNAAIGASNLSQAELLIGEVAAAVEKAEQSVAHADRNGDQFQITVNRATHADALRAVGRRDEAARVFADAERRQKEWQPAYPLLYSAPGYGYCNLLLGKGDHAAARDRALQTLAWFQGLYPLLVELWMN